jgi:hypothetical protein
MVFVKRGEANYRVGLLREALADFQQAARLPIDDQHTLDYVRAAILAVRRELKTSFERTVPAPSQFWRRFSRISKAMPVAVGSTSSRGKLLWRDS